MISIPRKFGALAAAAALSLGGAAGAAVAQGLWRAFPPEAAPARGVDNRAHFPVRRCLNMGGALEAPREGDWGYAIRRRDLQAVARAGFDTVRIQIKWSAHAAQTAPYAIDPAFFTRIDTVLTWALEARLNVILNVHHYDELFADPDRHEPRLEALWAQIAHRYQRTPPGVMFEIVNEPRDAFSGARVNAAQARVLEIIRRTNPTRTVIFAGDQWGSIEGMDNLRLPADPYVVGTVHYYGPYEFTHQGASWLPNAPPAGRGWPLPGDRQQLARDVDRMVQWRERLGAPVLMGEYGVAIEVPGPLRAAWTAETTAAFDAVGMPACHFNFASSFAIYDVASERWQAPMLAALGLRAP